MFWIALGLIPITLVLFFVLDNIIQKRYFEYDYYPNEIYHLKYTLIKNDYFLKTLIFLDLLTLVLSVGYLSKEIFSNNDIPYFLFALVFSILILIAILVFIALKHYVEKSIITKHINQEIKFLYGVSYLRACQNYNNLVDGFPLLRPSGHFTTELFKKTKTYCFAHNYKNLVYFVIAFLNASDKNEYNRELLQYCLQHIDDDGRRRYLDIIEELNSLKARAEHIAESKQEKFCDYWYYYRERKVTLKLLSDDNEYPHSALFYCQEIINEIESETEEGRSNSELEDYNELLNFNTSEK